MSDDADIARELTDLARHLLRHGNAEDAIALLDSALAILPDDVEIAMLQCEAAHRIGRDDEAHTRILGLLDRVPSDLRPTLEVLDAKVLLALGRRSEAETTYRRVFPDTPTIADDAGTGDVGTDGSRLDADRGGDAATHADASELSGSRRIAQERAQ